MGTELQVVYDAFLAKMLEDEWTGWSQEELAEDLEEILKGALPYFKFPKQSLAYKNGYFDSNLNNHEIQILHLSCILTTGKQVRQLSSIVLEPIEEKFFRCQYSCVLHETQ